jgi:hypothetical protein
LLQKLQNAGIDKNVVKTYKDILLKSTIDFDGQKVTTETGVAQGAVLSPTMFNLFINDLIEELNNLSTQITAYAFADDLVVICHSTELAQIAAQHASDWCCRNNIQINYDKSGALAPRVDRHSPAPLTDNIHGVKIVE